MTTFEEIYQYMVNEAKKEGKPTPTREEIKKDLDKLVKKGYIEVY